MTDAYLSRSGDESTHVTVLDVGSYSEGLVPLRTPTIGLLASAYSLDNMGWARRFVTPDSRPSDYRTRDSSGDGPVFECQCRQAEHSCSKLHYTVASSTTADPMAFWRTLSSCQAGVDSSDAVECSLLAGIVAPRECLMPCDRNSAHNSICSSTKGSFYVLRASR